MFLCKKPLSSTGCVLKHKVTESLEEFKSRWNGITGFIHSTYDNKSYDLVGRIGKTHIYKDGKIIEIPGYFSSLQEDDIYTNELGAEYVVSAIQYSPYSSIDLATVYIMYRDGSCCSMLYKDFIKDYKPDFNKKKILNVHYLWKTKNTVVNKDIINNNR